MNKKKKEKISYNSNAGNVPVNISKFNNSTFMGPDFSSNSFSGNSSGASVGEALDMLDKLEEENVNRTYTYEGPIYVDGYEDKHITMSTVAQSSRQALNNIKYRIADGDRYFMSRLSLSPDCLIEKGIKLPPKKIEREVEKEPEAVQLSMFSMNEEFNKTKFKYQIEDSVKRLLRKAFYQIPSIDVWDLGDEFHIEFKLSPYDAKIWMKGASIKKELAKDLEISPSNITVGTFSHPRLTLGAKEYTITVKIPQQNEDLNENIQLNEASLSAIQNMITTMTAGHPGITNISVDNDKKFYIITTSLGGKYCIPVEELSRLVSHDYKKLRYAGNGVIINGEIYDKVGGTHIGRAYYGVSTTHNHLDYDIDVYEYGKYPSPTGIGIDLSTFINDADNGRI